MHLQFMDHPVEGPEEGKEFLGPGFRLGDRGEVAMRNLIHGFLSLPKSHPGIHQKHGDDNGKGLPVADDCGQNGRHLDHPGDGAPEKT